MTATKIDLGEFDGDPVLGVGIEIRNVAGGLHDAFAIAPGRWHRGDKITVVLECEVTQVNHPPISDTEGVRRVHVTKALSGTVNGEARQFIEAHERQVAELREAEAQGPLDDALARSELIAAHAEGSHDDAPASITLANDAVIQCPDCEWEAS